MSQPVLHVIAPAPSGGAESVVLGLVEGMRAQGHRATIAAILNAPGPHPFVADAQARGLDVVEIRAGHRRYRRQARLIADLARERGATVVHTHAFHADVVGHWAARIAGLPVVTTLHGFTGSGAKVAVFDIALRWAHRRCAAVVAVSRPIATRLAERGVDPARIHLIPNAWAPTGTRLSRAEAATALGVAPDARRIVWAGRLSEEKGPDLMIEAFGLLARPDVRLSVVGDGPMRQELVGRADALGLSDRVTWHGMVPNAARLFPAFDLLAMSSRTEGAPMVLLEAMAMGLPVVAAGVGGIPGMFVDGEEALLVAPERPDLLAQALGAALDAPEATRQRASAALRRHEREFSVATWVSRHEDLYAFATRP